MSLICYEALAYYKAQSNPISVQATEETIEIVGKDLEKVVLTGPRIQPYTMKEVKSQVFKVETNLKNAAFEMAGFKECKPFQLVN